MHDYKLYLLRVRTWVYQPMTGLFRRKSRKCRFHREKQEKVLMVLAEIYDVGKDRSVPPTLRRRQNLPD